MNWKSSLLLTAWLAAPGLHPIFAQQLTQRTTPTISERDANSRTWEWTVEERSHSGVIISSEKHSYIELASGLHRQLADGSWMETVPEIEVSANRQHGLVRNLQYNVIFTADLAEMNSLDVLLPTGRRLTGSLLGLAYFDGNDSILIAEPKSTIGQIAGAAGTELVFRDAFTDFLVDVQYVVERDRFAQNLILRQRPPNPVELGLSVNAALVVLTEFTEAPPVQKIARLADARFPGIADEQLSLGSMEFAPGRGLSIGGGVSAPSQKIRHSLEIFEGGRQCLVEQIPWKELEPVVRHLPPVNADAVRRWKEKWIQQQAKARKSVLPERRMAQVKDGNREQMLAVNTTMPSLHSTRGYLLDFELVVAATNMVFAGDKSFYVTGPFNLAGTNRLESCVIKFAPTNGAKLNILGSLICDTAPHRPALLTGRDDHEAGETIGAAPLSGYYATNALVFANGGSELRNVRISHAYTGVSYENASGAEHTNMHVQFVNCLRGISGANSQTVRVRNVLMSSVKTNFETAGSFTARCENLTAASFDSLTNGAVTVCLTNTVLVGNGVFIYLTNLSQNVAAYTSSSGVFQQAGAGFFYAHGASGLRRAGTSNIDAQLLADLAVRTVDPPVILSTNYLLTNNPSWYPAVARGSTPPSIGYHYDAIDFAICLAAVESGHTLALKPGTVVACYGTGGLRAKTGSTLSILGQAQRPVTMASFINVQEQPGVWSNPENLLSAPDYTTGTTVTVKFAEFPVVGGSHYAVYCNHTGNDKNLDSLSVRDTRFYYGRNRFASTNGSVHTVGNNLFVRGDVQFRDKAGLSLFNNTFYAGLVSFDQTGSATWSITDNLFDQFAYSYQTIPNLSHGYNGYLNCGGNRIGASANHDQTINGTFAYDTGPLGSFYLGSAGSALLNAGSRNADAAGLFWETTGTNQVRETNSVVDIGFHVVATDGSGSPLDGDGDLLPSYLEDADGDGIKDSTESDWTLADTDGDGVSDYVEFLQGRNPNVGAVADTNGIVNLRVFTPLR